MAYSPAQQLALDAALKVYRDRIEAIPETLTKIEHLALSRNYERDNPYHTTHGENMVLKNAMKQMWIELRHDLNVAEDLGIINREQYYEIYNQIGDRLLAFDAANPKAFKII